MFLSVCKQQWIRFLLIVIAMHTVALDAQKNSARCQQVQDFVHADKRYMQFVFVDEHDNCTAGYYEAYDDPGDGGLFCYQNKIRIDTNLSQNHHQSFLQMHQQSVHRMQMHAISCNNIAQKQYISSLFLAGKISAEQAWMYEQMLEQKSLVAQVQKQANQVRKQAKKLDKNKVLLQEQSTIASTVIADLQQKNDAMLKRSCEQLSDDFYNVIKKRSKALKKSLDHQKVTQQKFSIKPQTAAFLQIQGIDARQFQELTGLPIQHQLGQEIVDLLDRLAAYALQKHEQQGLISYCAHLAQMTEQANTQYALIQAVQGTNCCHAIYHYLTGLLSTVGQAHQQFQTALAYFDSVADSYRTFVLQHAAQGAITTYGLEAITAAGMVVAPTVTVAATGMMIGATVCIIAPVCFQAGMHLKNFGRSCVVGDWKKVIKDLDRFCDFITSKETIARVAEFAGGASVSTPTLHYVVDQILSLRPVLVQVQNQAEQSVAKLYLMHKEKVKQVYQQSLELLQTPAFKHFHMMYEKILGCHFFDILPKNHPALLPVFAGIENNAISRTEQALLTHLFAEQEGSVLGQVMKDDVAKIVATTVVDRSAANVVENVTKDIVQNIVQQSIDKELLTLDINKNIQAINFINNAPAVDVNRFKLFMQSDFLVTGVEAFNDIRQLISIRNKTQNFTNISSLTKAEIYYANKIHYTQVASNYTKLFIENYKPGIKYIDPITTVEQIYQVKGLAFNHVHTGEYGGKDPTGCHCMPEYLDNQTFNPIFLKEGPLGTKYVRIYDPKNPTKFYKDTSLYPLDWSHEKCDMKMFEALLSDKIKIKQDKLRKNTLNIIGFTKEGMEIHIHYDIERNIITAHYPFIEI